MVVLAVIATWVVPGGEYERIEKDGRSISLADSFKFGERQPQGVGALFISPIKGFIEASSIHFHIQKKISYAIFLKRQATFWTSVSS
ncbi:MAG: hypothetical protein E3J44_01310 [Candidatus Aminicenantes bacterium]|nr:MAG: hypothetical protein E3J44_01310 [Candidatus Aminicenantes bacterium]